MLVVAIVGAAFLVLDGVSLIAVRNWSNYASVFVISACASVLAEGHRPTLKRAVWVAVIVWFGVGMLQTAVSPDLGTALLSGARRDAVRGVVGLAPEPTMYACICLTFMIAALVLFEGRERRLLMGLAVFQIIFFARSAMGLMLLMLWATLWLVGELRSAKGLLLASATAAGMILLLWLLISGRLPGLEEARIRTLATMAIQNPSYLFLVDQSGAARLSAIVYAIAGFLRDWGLPHGFVQWDDFTRTIAHKFYMIPDVPGGYRPMSGYGAALFELGFLSVLLFIAVTWAFLAFYRRGSERVWPTLIFFHLLLLTAIPLATPTIGLVVGILAVGRQHDQQDGVRAS